MTNIVVPALGESVTEATVAQWLKKEGEAVKADEPLVELETDKVTLEVNAPSDGVIAKIQVGEGENVEVGAILGEIEAGEATNDAGKAKAKEAKPEEKEEAPAQKSDEDGPKTSPAVRKMVNDNNLKVEDIPASGKDGRLTKEDVQNYVEGGANAPAPTAETSKAGPTTSKAPMPRGGDPVPSREDGALEERVRMTRLRQKIAERLKEAQDTAAILTTFNEIDMGPVMALRKEYKEAFQKKHGVKLGFMSFFIRAAIQALKEFPAVNAEIDDEQKEIIFKNYYDIGVAVSTPQGLVVPVLREADKMTMAQIENSILDLSTRAREGKLSIEEMSGGTFTITNGGVFGSLMSTPILNRPQSAILGMHKIQQRPMVMPNGSIEARPMMYVAMSYDHRIIDGKDSVSFLVRIKEAVEDPARLLLDV